MSAIISTEDFAIWTLGHVTPNTPLDLIRAGDTGPFFALRDCSGDGASAKAILRSTDGKHWDLFTDPLAVSSTNAIPAGLAYSLIKDELYISYQDDDHVFTLVKASQVIAAQCNVTTEAASNILTEGVPGYWKILSSPGTPARGPRNIVNQLKGVP